MLLLKEASNWLDLAEYFPFVSSNAWATVSMHSKMSGIRHGYLSMVSSNELSLDLLISFRYLLRFCLLALVLVLIRFRCRLRSRGKCRGEAEPNFVRESECQPSQLFIGSLRPNLFEAPCHTSLLGLSVELARLVSESLKIGVRIVEGLMSNTDQLGSLAT